MEFEYDPAKSESNRIKHGIDFEEAQALWLDDHVEIPTARMTDEVRELAIGRIEGRFWSGVLAWREGRIRIISVRRSRNEEIAIYEGNDR